jgi:hypothetical protein
MVFSPKFVYEIIEMKLNLHSYNWLWWWLNKFGKP